MFRRARCLLIALLGVAVGSCDPQEDPRAARVLSTLTRADLPWLRARPALVAVKYRAMGASLFDYYRGSYAVFARDALEGDPRAAGTRFAPGALVAGIGDAHPENVGVLIARDGTPGLEFNDFDAADRVPYAWDLRRLCAGLVLAARVSNPEDPSARAQVSSEARSIARSAAASYFTELRRLLAGGAPERVIDGRSAPQLEDLFRRGARDLARRTELDELTETRDGARRLRRGVLDPADPEGVLRALPAVAREALDRTIEEYRHTLSDPHDARYFSILDAARQLGSGVASLPRVRVLVLVRGPTDEPADDVILEVKELGDSGSPGTAPPFVWADSVSQRVRASAWTAWGDREREPLWSTGLWLGLPVQIRAEREAHKTLRTARMTGALGTRDALERTARVLGALLARVHVGTNDGRASARWIVGDGTAEREAAFGDEHADATIAYAAQVEADWNALRQALSARGSLLGFVPDPDDAPPADARALLFGREVDTP